MSIITTGYPKKTESELYFLAYHDALTKLYNRNMLEELRPELDKKKLYVSMIDINYLKDINDSQGHAAGDERIKAIAAILSENSQLAFRLGGDEFLCINETAPIFNLWYLAACGITLKKEDISLSSAMKHADALMYAEKEYQKLSFESHRTLAKELLNICYGEESRRTNDLSHLSTE